MWFNPCAFVAPPGQFGNEGRDNLLAPGYYDLDSKTLGFIPSANAYSGRPPRQIQWGLKVIFEPVAARSDKTESL